MYVFTNQETKVYTDRRSPRCLHEVKRVHRIQQQKQQKEEFIWFHYRVSDIHEFQR